jgi:RNA polymerase sigma-70 factor (ECF subfamily)
MNEARSRLRKVSSTPVESLDSKVESEEECTPAMIADWREIPLEMLEREELAGQIRKAIEELPSSYREVFLLRDKGELSIAEIAESLGIQANLVKVRLFRARMSLQKTLTPYLKQQISSGKRWYSWMGGAR